VISYTFYVNAKTDILIYLEGAEPKANVRLVPGMGSQNLFEYVGFGFLLSDL
jgi:hypothetical protein